jgi:predicted lipoprotein with Yx(FWY)xxD motif
MRDAHIRHHRFPSFSALAALGFLLACGGPKSGGIADNPQSGGASGSSGTSGAANDASESGGSAGEATGGTGGDSGSGGSEGSGATDSGTGGTGNSGTGGTGGTDGTGGAGGTSCIFHDYAPDSGSDAGSVADSGVDGGPPSTITVQNNPSLGAHLGDSKGQTLYIYTADKPGDCMRLPVSTCVADCAITWPSFHAGELRLPAGLDASVFGSIRRDDGTLLTTYYGWPLYYYEPDNAPGDVFGQGRGKIWFAAETVPQTIIVMRSGTSRYLATFTGSTLYTYARDTRGDGSRSPSSACTDACRAQFPPLVQDRISVVSVLEPSDFSVFLRGDGLLQVAFKGSPLYRATSDVKPGDVTGVNTPDWTLTTQ